MRKTVLLKLFTFAICAFPFSKVMAQNNIDILGARLSVDAPTAVNHPIKFTYSFATTGASWGGNITNPIVHQEVAKAVDSLACGGITNSVAGKWALIYRGDCEFGQKALHAQQAGATGVIIWNHTANQALVNMSGGTQGANVTIPVIFISNEDGRELTNQLSAGQQTFVTITKWGFNKAHDLAIVPFSPAMPPAAAVPVNQFDGTSVPGLMGYTGAYIANIGTSTETNVKLKSVVSFTPAGGSPTVVNQDSLTVASFTVTDSIRKLYSNNDFKFTPSGPGTYNFTYTLSSDSTDALPSDNTFSYTMEVTPNAYCKGRFDVSKQAPVIRSQSFISSNNTPVASTWGPIFYNHKGGYSLNTVVFSATGINTDGTLDTNNKSMSAIGLGAMDFYIFKWKDGDGGPLDSAMEASEMKFVSLAHKVFSAADSNNGKVAFTALCGNPDGTNGVVSTEDDSWYWVAADLQQTYTIGLDAETNYYTRAYAARHYATTKFLDYWSPRYEGTGSDIPGNTSTFVLAIPFFPAAITYGQTGNIDSTDITRTDGVPNIALFTSVYPTTVKKTATESANHYSLFPNPATEFVTVKYDFEKPASKTYFKIIDAFGRSLRVETKENTQKGEITVSTKGLPVGSYYMIIGHGETAVAKPFTIVK
jgi:hypothetical protein